MSNVVDGQIANCPTNGRPPANAGGAQLTTVEPHPGEFFAIDSRIWTKVTSCGMNDAVAYLVLASGTGYSNKETSWSTQSVMTYAGVGWSRAKSAIEKLLAGGFIRYAKSSTGAHPRYEFATYNELGGIGEEKTLPAKLDELGQNLLSNQNLHEAANEAFDGSLIWLPNTIVTGTSSGEESPVKRLHSVGCIMTLRLFVDLYTFQNLRDDGGIHTSILRKSFERRRIGYEGGYGIWGFVADMETHSRTGPFAGHCTCMNNEPEPEEVCPVTQRLYRLERMGLLSFVPHIFQNDTDSAEPIHVYGIGKTGEVPIEKMVGDVADRAARAMATPSRLLKAEEDGFDYFCPILDINYDAQMIGVARLTYRPHTKRTATWFAELQKAGPAWIETFGKLAAIGKKTALQRERKYA